jgi:hypothetical protein
MRRIVPMICQIDAIRTAFTHLWMVRPTEAVAQAPPSPSNRNIMKRTFARGLFGVVIGAVVILSTHDARTTADGCGVVLKTPDGLLNIRKGSSIHYPSIATVRPGDILYLDDKSPCFALSPDKVEYDETCKKYHDWIYVTGKPKRPMTLDGWIRIKFVDVRGDCLESGPSEKQEAVVLINSFAALPSFVQREANEIRDACMKVEETSKSFWDEMQGIHSFYLPGDKSISILVDDRHVCNTQTKGGNCHTWGCDVRIYRAKYSHRTGTEWVKVFDEVTVDLFLSISTRNEFILAGLSIVGKHDRCGRNYDIGHCEFLLFWKNEKWVWQRLRYRSNTPGAVMRFECACGSRKLRSRSTLSYVSISILFPCSCRIRCRNPAVSKYPELSLGSTQKLCRR